MSCTNELRTWGGVFVQQSIVSARGLSPCKVYKRWAFPAIETFVSSWVDLGFEPQKRNSRRKTVKVAFFASSHGIIFSRVAFRRCEQYEGLSVSLALTSPRNLGGDNQDSAIARCECLRFCLACSGSVLSESTRVGERSSFYLSTSNAMLSGRKRKVGERAEN